MRRNIILIIFIFVVIKIELAQQPLQVIFDTEYGIGCSKIIEDNNNDYVLCCSEGYEDMNYHFNSWGRIIKLTQNFDISSKLIIIPDTDMYFSDIVVTDINKYITIGSYGYDTGYYYKCTNIIIGCLDENLETVNQTFTALPDGYFNPSIYLCKGPDDRIYAAGYANFLGFMHFFLLKIDSNGNILQSNFPQYPDSAYTNRIIGISDFNFSTNTFVAFGTSFDYTSTVQAIEIDTNLNYSITGLNDLQNGYSFGVHASSKWINDSTMIFSSCDNPDNNKFIFEDLFVAKINNTYEFIDEPIWIGREDTTDFPPKYSIDFKTTDNIFLGAFSGQSASEPFEYNYFVGLIDESMNKKGEKRIGEDNINYSLMAMVATSDGGCIFVSTRNDFLNTPDYDWDLHILKLYPNDIITSAAETPLKIDSDYNIFPNPGKDELYIQTSNKGVTIQLFNERGIVVLSEQLDDNYTSTINTSGLSSGLYFYRVTDKRGFSESGKWIKK